MIRYSFPPRPIPEQEAQDSARAFQARLDSIPVPLDRMRGMSDMARRGELPTVLPEILAIQVDRKGNIWLKRWPRSGEKETVFDILSPSGAPLSTVRIPADLLPDPVPWVSPKVVVGVVRHAATQTDRAWLYSGCPAGKQVGSETARRDVAVRDRRQQLSKLVVTLGEAALHGRFEDGVTNLPRIVEHRCREPRTVSIERS